MSEKTMDDWQLSTPRLRLRRLTASDRPWLVKMLGDYEVTKNLAVWSHPVDEARVDDLIERHKAPSPGGFGICYGDELAGLIGAGERIGYMLARPYWGLGIMTEALNVVQKFATQTLEHEALSADAFVDNPASQRILEKCGWALVGHGKSFSKARGEMVKDHHFVKCARSDWREPIQTERLILRPPNIDDFEAMAEIVSDAELADLLIWPWPYDPEILKNRLTNAKARAGLVSAITLNGETIGRVSAGGGHIGFMLRRQFWGKGYATEAVSAKITQAFQHPKVQKLEAGTWEGNHASLKLLSKLGFVQTGWGRVFSNVRETELEGPEFTLTRARWEGMQ